ncbi:hypothetical protein V2A60_008414 [Cordyceps javanica]
MDMDGASDHEPTGSTSASATGNTGLWAESIAAKNVFENTIDRDPPKTNGSNFAITRITFGSIVMLFWSIYTMDRGNALRLGYAPTIQDYDIDTPMPVVSEEYPSAIVTIKKYWVDCARVQGKICTRLYGPAASALPHAERAQLAEAFADELDQIYRRKVEAKSTVVHSFASKQNENRTELWTFGDDIMYLSTSFARDSPKSRASIPRYAERAGMPTHIISEYTLGKSIGALDRADMAREYNDALRNSAKLGPIARAFPFIARAMVMLPDWVVKSRPELAPGKEFQELVNNLTRMAFEDAEKPEEKGDRTILQTLMNHPTAPEKEKRFNRLSAEVMIMFAAGGEPTGRALAVTLLHILLDPPVYKRVLSELRPLIPSYDAPLPPTKQLEGLPYFSAVISEGLRMAHGVAGRLGRIAPNETLNYPNGKNGIVQIPAGVTFSQTLYLVHTNEEIFPQPFAFRPERYLLPENATEAETQAVNTAKAYLVPFGKGSRSCLGMNLAYSELYLTLAAIIAGLELELAEGISEKDGRITQEYLIGCLDESRAGIAIKVLGKI